MESFPCAAAEHGSFAATGALAWLDEAGDERCGTSHAAAELSANSWEEDRDEDEAGVVCGRYVGPAMLGA